MTTDSVLPKADWALPKADTYFTKLLTERGFEIDHLDEALKFCKRFRTAFDGGAHIGTWSVNLAKRFKNVLACEPCSDTFLCLVENTKGYSNINPVRVALGSEEGHCLMVDDPVRKGNTGARIMRPNVYDEDLIQLTTVDFFELEKLDFLKLDLEGSELGALMGAVRTIKRCQPTIMVECKEFSPLRNGGVAAVKSFLLNDLGYVEVGGIRNDRVFVPI